MNERIKKLRKLLRDKSHHQFRKESLGISILDDQNGDKPFVIRKALSFRRALEEMPIFIQDGELIVGGRTVYSLPAYVTDEELQTGIKNFEDEGYDSIFDIHYNLGQDERGYGRPDGDPPNYKKLVQLGIPGITGKVMENLKNTEDEDGRNYYNAVLICYDGLKSLIGRYAALARDRAGHADELRSRELEKIVSVCENLLVRKPADFWEALQLIYFVHFCCWTEDSYLIPIGRFDQIMYDFYRSDVLDGKKFRHEDIRELVECFFIKLNFEIDKTHGKSGKFESDTGQTIVLGGVDPSTKKDAGNELTYMIIDIYEDLRITDPKLHIRFHERNPEELWDKAVDLTSLGMGFPTFDNDHAIFEALRKVGNGYYREEDIYDYGISGCWEVIIPGRTSFRQCCNFDLLQPLEWILNRGYGFRDIERESEGPFDEGRRWGFYTGDLEDHKTFHDLMKAYKKQVRYAVMMNAYAIIVSRTTHQPFLSSLIDDCIERGKDVNEGGARYNETDMQCCSLANTADSLYIIKKLVYDEGRFSLRDFVEIVKNDYEGHEDLRNEILNKYDHFGNDSDEIDTIARDVAGFFADEYSRYTNALNGPFRPRISGATSSVYFSKVLGPSPDGRKLGDFLASNASPQPGAAKEGPTAVAKSLTKLDLSKFAGGAMLNLKFAPRMLQDREGREGLKNLIKAYFELGGLQIQLNVVSSAVLKEAQQNPQEYRDLIVRVWGFSTYFVSLPKDYQDQLINETEMSVH